ncbi:MAG: hypothetical protein GY754_36080 [bacterium]|nr:hypothetical protein [bacterium]
MANTQKELKEQQVYEHELSKEFLQSLHREKISRQESRGTYSNRKIAFITGLLGISTLKIGQEHFFWLLFLVPLVAVGYDIYINSADIHIKKIGAFLRNNPEAGVAENEKAWERFSSESRSKFARIAVSFFTVIATIVAAAGIVIGAQAEKKGDMFWIGYLVWIVSCFTIIVLMLLSQNSEIEKFDNYKPKTGD